MCARECVSQCVCLNLRFSAEDMPHLSITEGLLIGDVMEVARILAGGRSEHNYIHKSPSPNLHGIPDPAHITSAPQEGRGEEAGDQKAIYIMPDAWSVSLINFIINIPCQ